MAKLLVVERHFCPLHHEVVVQGSLCDNNLFLTTCEPSVFWPPQKICFTLVCLRNVLLTNAPMCSRASSKNKTGVSLSFTRAKIEQTHPVTRRHSGSPQGRHNSGPQEHEKAPRK